MQGLLNFIKSRQFIINLVLILATVFLLLFLTNKWLASYTGHDQFAEVPDFKGRDVKQLDTFVKNSNINYKIIDSLYDPKAKSGIVLRQYPDAGSKVKHNRTVYLYVTGMVAPQIIMPKLISRSERQARLILETYGLKVGRITEESADCDGCVVSQLQKGRPVEPGKPVKKGSVIDLVLGVKGSRTPDAVADTGQNKAPEKPDFDKGDD